MSDSKVFKVATCWLKKVKINEKLLGSSDTWKEVEKFQLQTYIRKVKFRIGSHSRLPVRLF